MFTTESLDRGNKYLMEVIQPKSIELLNIHKRMELVAEIGDTTLTEREELFLALGITLAITATKMERGIKMKEKKEKKEEKKVKKVVKKTVKKATKKVAKKK